MSLPTAIQKNNAMMVHSLTSVYKKAQSLAEIRKNSRILAQGLRDNCSLFKSLPKELAVEIAALTGNPAVHDEKESKNIALQNLGKPSLLKFT